MSFKHNTHLFFVCVCRDRVSCVWQTVREHLYHLCVNATESCFLVERAVVGLLRLAIRLLRREDISSQVHKSIPRLSAFIIMLYPKQEKNTRKQYIYHKKKTKQVHQTVILRSLTGSSLPAPPADDETSCPVPGQQGGGLWPS